MAEMPRNPHRRRDARRRPRRHRGRRRQAICSWSGRARRSPTPSPRAGRRGRRRCCAAPANNGGDGYVVARRLAEARLAGARSRRRRARRRRRRGRGAAELDRPDASAACRRRSDGAELVVDALFGAGLSRPLDGQRASALRRRPRPWRCPSWPSTCRRACPATRARPLGLRAPRDPDRHLPRQEAGPRAGAGRGASAARSWSPTSASRPRRRPRAAVGERARALGGAACPGPRPEAHKHQRGRLSWSAATSGAPARRGWRRAAGLRIGAGLVTVLSPARRRGGQRRPARGGDGAALRHRRRAAAARPTTPTRRSSAPARA